MVAGTIRILVIVAILGGPSCAQSYHAFFFDQKSDIAKAFEKQVDAARDSLTEFLRLLKTQDDDVVRGFVESDQSNLSGKIEAILEASRSRSKAGRELVATALAQMESRQLNFTDSETAGPAAAAATRAAEKILIDLQTNFSLEDKDAIKKHFARFGETPPAIDHKDDHGFVTAPFLQASEEDGDFFSSLKPGAFVGAVETFRISKSAAASDSQGFPWRMDIKAGLVFAGGLDARDSLDFKRALLYPGTMNVLVATNVRPPFLNGRFAKVSLPNLTASLKFIPGLRDTSATIVQLSAACGAAIQIKSSIMVYGQIIWSRHDVTSESEKSFGQAFPTAVDEAGDAHTQVRQYFIGLQFSVGERESQGRYFYLEWRKLPSNCRVGEPGGDKFLTFGFRNEITL